MDITKCKKNLCPIAGTSDGKSLVYQSDLIVTERAVLVVLPIITFMKDQVCIAPKMLYNHLHSIM